MYTEKRHRNQKEPQQLKFIKRGKMSAARPGEDDRETLQKVMNCYTTDTFCYITRVRDFFRDINDWMLLMKTNCEKMKTIKVEANKTNPKINHVTKSKHKGKALGGYLRNKVIPGSANSTKKKLAKELDKVLKDTLEGLEKLDDFLDAVEKLAVTSLYVFMENPVLHLPKEIRLKDVQVVIAAAQFICPMLLEFKRDAKSFFNSRIQNVEVLIYQLDKYIQTTQRIYDLFKRSEFPLNMSVETLVELSVDSYEDGVQLMLEHINQLGEIRMNQAFRMVFLFGGQQSFDFISKFSERKLRMRQFLQELEETAVQLDRMKKGAKISSVAGRSVSAVGGILSITGLALMPFTAGASLALTMTGLGLGITSGVNSLVTTATEIGVNYTQNKKAKEAFQHFMEDVKALQDCLEEVMQRDKDINVLARKLLWNVGAVGKQINSLSIFATLDVSDIGEGLSGPLANLGNVGLIGANALFLGINIFFICKDSISLAKGTETDISCFIRARAELWSSQIDSWQKIHDLLKEGLLKSEKNKEILKTDFYLEMRKKKETNQQHEAPQKAQLETPFHPEMKEMEERNRQHEASHKPELETPFHPEMEEKKETNQQHEAPHKPELETPFHPEMEEMEQINTKKESQPEEAPEKNKEVTFNRWKLFQQTFIYLLNITAYVLYK